MSNAPSTVSHGYRIGMLMPRPGRDAEQYVCPTAVPNTAESNKLFVRSFLQRFHKLFHVHDLDGPRQTGMCWLRVERK